MESVNDHDPIAIGCQGNHRGPVGKLSACTVLGRSERDHCARHWTTVLFHSNGKRLWWNLLNEISRAISPNDEEPQPSLRSHRLYENGLTNQDFADDQAC